MQKSEHKRDTRYYLIRCLNPVGLISLVRVFFKKTSKSADSRNERKKPERMGGSNIQAESQRDNSERRNIFGSDRVDFIGNFEVYQLIREAFERQGLEYRASYYRTAWNHHGGAKLITQTVG